MEQAGLPLEYWAEAARTACYLRNRSPSSALEGFKTPYQAFTGKKPNLSHIRTFGCIAYVQELPKNRTKLENKATTCILLGYSAISKAYRLQELNSKRILESRNVVFDENLTLKNSKAVQSHPATLEVDLEDAFDEEIVQNAAGSDSGAESDQESEFEDAREQQTPRKPSSGRSQAPPAPRKSARASKAPGEWWKVQSGNIAFALATAMKIMDPEPNSYKEAMLSSEKEQWQAAMNEEYSSLMKNQTWELVELPKDRKAIASRWHFRHKFNANGTLERHKARWVAKGFSQQEGVDFFETWAPVAKWPTVRLFLSVAAMLDMEIEQMDVNTAFLNPEIDETIYVKQPEGYIKEGDEHLVCKLKKTLYGLKQSPREWYKLLDAFLKQLGFKGTNGDSCLYIKTDENKPATTAMICIYVDDLNIATKDIKTMQVIKKALANRFSMKDLGPLGFYLGVSITRDRQKRTIQLSQQTYVEKMLKTFNLSECKPVSIPLEPGHQLSNAQSPQNEQERKGMASVPYRNAVGSLIYAMVATRPDIAAAVGVVSQFLANPGEAHWKATKRIFAYLQGTKIMKLELGGAKLENPEAVKLVGYSDSDWGGCHDTRKSTTGLLFDFGGPISWKSKRQHTIALSTAEAEYMAITEAAKEAIWLRELLKELGFAQKAPTTLKSDNQGAIALAKNPVHHARTKHIDIRHHFIRDTIESGQINLEYCRTEDMTADIFTKGLAKPQFTKLRDLMHLKLF
jgi:hypothetical protein